MKSINSGLGLAMFLASPAPGMITSQSISVDGGW
jgi:hypothetical protein